MFVELAWWVFLTPLIVLPLVAILEYKKTNAGAILSILSVLVSLIISAGILFEVLGGVEYEEHYLALKVGELEFNYGIFVDPVSAFMGFVVSFISLWVLVYSIEYMSHEKEKSRLALPRYWVEITLFVGSMLGLVYSYSLWQMYIFWELVSLCSYLLIGYWWTDPGNAGKATKALVITRFADAFFMAGMVLAIFPPPVGAGTWDIPIILKKAMTGALPGYTCSILAMLLFIGCMGKSAQLPFSTWLPDAMVGPTTVSALIHAATYVKAGVYAVARFYPLFVHGSPIEIWGISFLPLQFVAWIGAITGVWAGLIAITSRDIKRVLAFSTISHLAFIMFAFGIGAFAAAMLHIIVHGFFKALLFLDAGAVLHETHETKDLYMLGGLWNKMKITAVTALIGSLTISGIPPLSGFFSKEEILHAANMSPSMLLFLLGFIIAICSSFYIFRWFFLIFTGKPRSHAAEEAEEAPYVMTVPLMILAAGCIVIGILNAITHVFETLFEHLPEAYALTHVETHSTHEILPGFALMGLSLGIALIGILLNYSVYYAGKISPEAFTRPVILRGIHKFLFNETYLDKAIYWFTMNCIAYGIARALRWFDNVIVDGVYRGLAWLAVKFSDFMYWFDNTVVDGVYRGLAWLGVHLSNLFRRPQTGLVNYYAVAGVLGLLALLLLFGLWLLGIITLL